MLGLALSTLRHRKAGFVGAFVGLFCAAALVSSCGMLMDTGLRGVVEPERYVGAPVIVSGDQDVRAEERKSSTSTKTKTKPLGDRAWVAASVADRLRAVPGVRSVVTEVDLPAAVGAAPGAESWGHGWESAALTPFTLASGRAPEADGEIVVDAAARLAVGATTPLRTPAGTGVYRVVGVTAQSLPHQSTVFFGTAEARRLAGHDGQYSAIGVYPAGVAPAVVDALRGTAASVFTGDERGRVEFPGADTARTRLISMGAALGGTSLLVAVLVVAGTFALSGQRRQRELALLRAIAATPRQIRAMIGGEALVVSAVAGTLGAAAGIGLAFWLRDTFAGLGAIPVNLPLVVGPFPPLVAVAATLAAAWAAARVSARRIAAIRPVEALGDAAMTPPRVPVLRLAAGAVALAGGVVMTVLLSTIRTERGSGPLTPVTTLVWITAVALLGPPIARGTVAALGPALRLSRIGGWLAAANLRTDARRLAGVVTSLSLMVGMACTLLFAQTTMAHARGAEALAGNRADYVLGTRIGSGAAEDVRWLPGVRAVTEVLHTTVWTGVTSHSAQAVTPAGLSQTLDLDVRAGSIDRLAEDTVAVREGLGPGLGDDVPLSLADGTPVTLRVVAVYGRGLGFGDLTLAHDLVARHVDVPLNDSVLVAAPTVDRATLVGALRGEPGVAVLDRITAVSASSDGGTAVNYVALGLIVGFAAISVVNSLTMSTLGRSREFGLLRLVGTTRRQVLRMLAWEAGTVALIATVLGTAVALATLWAYSTGMTGMPTPYVPLPSYLSVVAVAAALALVATALPAALALRTRPTDAIGVGE
ncbi:ABC transporter permease [Solihabitans fulvus]|uniref:ABC transporter permease n=2 Tax=Solihabitans fulvus TaxID=1892852 RepID=A0A5B2XDE9_9PSEU|nr:ABC transporter permease [Solihabitans fulvus]